MPVNRSEGGFGRNQHWQIILISAKVVWWRSILWISVVILSSHTSPIVQVISLKLAMCDLITDEGFVEAVVKLPLLEDFDLHGCWNIKFVGDLEKRCLEKTKDLKRPFDLIAAKDFDMNSVENGDEEEDDYLSSSDDIEYFYDNMSGDDDDDDQSDMDDSYCD